MALISDRNEVWPPGISSDKSSDVARLAVLATRKISASSIVPVRIADNVSKRSADLAIEIVASPSSRSTRRRNSALLPAIDLAFLTCFLGKPASGNTVIELEQALAARRGR